MNVPGYVAGVEICRKPKVSVMSAGNMTMNGVPYKPEYNASVDWSGPTRKYVLPYKRYLRHVIS